MTEYFLLLCFGIFLVYWFIASFSVKRTIERAGGTGRIIVFSIGAFIFLLFAQGRAHGMHRGGALWPRTVGVRLLADAVTLAGLMITLWARRTLGANWSAQVALKEDHEIIERGPYSRIRHPIYSGLALMLLGVAVYVASWFGIAIFVLSVGGFWLKARREEALLTKHFGETYPAYMRRTKMLIPGVW